jgi:hypothetical protein
MFTHTPTLTFHNGTPKILLPPSLLLISLAARSNVFWLIGPYQLVINGNDPTTYQASNTHADSRHATCPTPTTLKLYIFVATMKSNILSLSIVMLWLIDP